MLFIWKITHRTWYLEFLTSKMKCYFSLYRKPEKKKPTNTHIYIYINFLKKKKESLPHTDFIIQWTPDLIMFCGDHKTYNPSETIYTTWIYKCTQNDSIQEKHAPLWFPPKHLTIPMACAEAARGLLVTRASSPKYCPREHRAISTAPFSSTSDLPWQSS